MRSTLPLLLALLFCLARVVLPDGAHAQRTLRPLQPNHWGYELVEVMEALGAEGVWTSWHRPVLSSGIHESLERARVGDAEGRYRELLGRWGPLLRREVGVDRTRPGQVDVGLGWDGDETAYAGERGVHWSGAGDGELGSRGIVWAEGAGTTEGSSLTLRTGGVGVRAGPLVVLGGRLPVSVGQGRDRILLGGRTSMDGIFIGSNGPARMPGPLRWLGRVSGHFFLAPKIETPNVDGAWFGTMGLDFAPHPRVRIGASRTVRFAGEGQGPVTVGNLLKTLYWGGEGSDFDDSQGEVSIRLRIGPQRRSVTTYLSLGFEDTQSIYEDPGIVAGALLPLLLDRGLLTLRYEYSAFGQRAQWCGSCEYQRHLWYHGRWYGPYVHDGVPMGSELGGYGSSHWIESVYWATGMPVRVAVSAFRRNREPGNILLDRWSGIQKGVSLEITARPRPGIEIRGAASATDDPLARETGFQLSMHLFDLFRGL